MNKAKKEITHDEAFSLASFVNYHLARIGVLDIDNFIATTEGEHTGVYIADSGGLDFIPAMAWDESLAWLEMLPGNSKERFWDELDMFFGAV